MTAREIVLGRYPQAIAVRKRGWSGWNRDYFEGWQIFNGKQPIAEICEHELGAWGAAAFWIEHAQAAEAGRNGQG